jgi:hypothetical protein
MNSLQCQTTREYCDSSPAMLSHTQLSSPTVVVHSIRQPWVDMSMTFAATLLRLPSRMVAFSRSAVLATRRRSGCFC